MNTDTITLPQQIARMDAERLRGYGRYLSFYKGDQWRRTSLSQSKVGQIEDADIYSKSDAPWVRRITFNYARTIVDKITSYLMSELNFAVDPVDNTPEARDMAGRVEEILYQVYDRNHLAQLDFDTEVDAAVLGDACYKVIWDPDAKDVRVSAPDVQGIFAWWAGDDITRVWRVASRYILAAEEVRMLYGVGVKENMATVVEVWTDKTFELWIGDSRVKATRNSYGFIPFVIFANVREPKQFWGVSDLASIMEPARELNRALSQLSMILELSGNPIAVLENVDRADDIAVQPGAVWEIPERAKAYLLDLLAGGGVKLHADYVDMLYRTLYDLGETPRTSFGENQRALSGVALEMELHPLLQKIRRKRLSRSVAYQQRNEMILRLLAARGGVSSRAGLEKLRTRVIWGPVLPQDRQRLVDEETRLVAAGIHSRQRAADNLGVPDPEAEYGQWLEEEKQKIAVSRQERAVSSQPSAVRGRSRELIADG